jgi:hypothetical protein
LALLQYNLSTFSNRHILHQIATGTIDFAFIHILKTVVPVVMEPF